MNSERKKTTPKNAKLTMTPTRLAPLKVRLRKNLSCSSGVLPRSSTTRNKAEREAGDDEAGEDAREVQP